MSAPARRPATPLARYVTAQWWPSGATVVGFLRFERLAYDRSVVLVRVFYAASAMFAVQHTNQWASLAHGDAVSPLWPAAWWFDRFASSTGVHIMFTAYLVASLLAVFFPERRLFRAAYSVMLLQQMAVVGGFFKINHSFHAWLAVSVVLVFLPAGHWRDRRRVSDRHNFLAVIWSAQLLMLLFYTLTGAWKVWYAITQFFGGEVSAFHVRGFSLILGDTLLRADADTVVGDFVVRHQWLGWALFLGTMYLETCSVIVAFRPRLHRVWGGALILFHIGTGLAMAISFLPNVLLLGVFLVNSPFLPEHVTLRELVLDLPGVRLFARDIVPRLRGRPRGIPRPARAPVGARPLS